MQCHSLGQAVEPLFYDGLSDMGHLFLLLYVNFFAGNKKITM